MKTYLKSEENIAKKVLIEELYEYEDIVSVSLKFLNNIDNTPNNLIIGNNYNGYKIINSENNSFSFVVFCEYKGEYRFRFFDKDKFELISLLN